MHVNPNTAPDRDNRNALLSKSYLFLPFVAKAYRRRTNLQPKYQRVMTSDSKDKAHQIVSPRHGMNLNLKPRSLLLSSSLPPLPISQPASASVAPTPIIFDP